MSINAREQVWDRVWSVALTLPDKKQYDVTTQTNSRIL
jgi:hypothetical protein